MEKQKVIWYLEMLAKLGILTVGFLQACSLTFGKSIISLFLWPTVFLGALLIFIRLIQWKHYWKSKNFFLLIAFCVSYVVSIALNIHYGWYTNVTTLIWLGILLFLVYCYRTDISSESMEKQYRILISYYLIVNAVMVIAGFVCMFGGYSKIFFPENGPIYYIGFHWGRLFGIYWDANIGAMLCVVAVLLSLGFWGQYKHIFTRILLGLNIMLHILFITFSDSRTGKLALSLGCAVFVFVYLWNKKKIALAVVGMILTALLCYYLPSGIKMGYNELISMEIKAKIEAGEDISSIEDLLEDNLPETLGREEDYSSDISNRRFDIWKSALDIFKTSPIVGITHNNVRGYVEKNLPDSYLITNDYMKFDSMHNTFLDILVAQGALGLGIYLIMALSFLVKIIKGWKYIFADNSTIAVSRFAILASMILASCVMTEIVYVTSPMAAVFWMSLSGLMKHSDGSSN